MQENSIESFKQQGRIREDRNTTGKNYQVSENFPGCKKIVLKIKKQPGKNFDCREKLLNEKKTIESLKKTGKFFWNVVKYIGKIQLRREKLWK